MKVFLTGSHAYGTPNENSDIDLCIYISQEDLDKLVLLNDSKFVKPLSADGAEYPVSRSLRFGDLNLIAHTDLTQYNLWKEATEALIKHRPVTRDYAVQWIKDRINNEPINISKSVNLIF